MCAFSYVPPVYVITVTHIVVGFFIATDSRVSKVLHIFALGLRLPGPYYN